MEDTTKRKHVTLINELIQGKELANQLSSFLVSSPSSHQTNEFLIEQILSSYEKAISMLNSVSNAVGVGEIMTPNGNIMDSHCSDGSPRSEVMDLEFEHKAAFKKRRTMPRWTEQVKICSKQDLRGLWMMDIVGENMGKRIFLELSFPG
ncbi:hypothetical protein SESBI_18643 [Sesbania bispinosa]|nr:hypothetical protein SESBI_18643 [Sesbania bispinosa]